MEMMSRYRKNCLIISLACFAGAALILLNGCASNWTQQEKVKYGTIVALQAVDVYQTDRLTADGHKELNPDARDIGLNVVMGISGGVVVWNSQF